MDELRDMASKANSLQEIKEKYQKAIINNFKEKLAMLKNIHGNDDIEKIKMNFNNTQYQNAFDNSLGSNDRWGIVSKKNFFGLSAEFLPENEKDNALYLKLDSGRFQMQKFPTINKNFFPNLINISDILQRSEKEQFAELEEFYNMNNREVFEKYGITAHCSDNYRGQSNLVANCVILDSLLQEKYSNITDIFCYSPEGYVIQIELDDGTKISANSINSTDISQTGKKGITIKKDEKEANVDFDAVSIGTNSEVLTNISELEVKNVVYTGDTELITKLQQAMEKQFESQKNTALPEYNNYYEKYDKIASILLDKASVYSYNEDYELDGLLISCINDGSSVCIKSEALGIVFLIDGKSCTFHDFDELVKIDYYPNSEEKPLEQIEIQNKEIIERIKEFTKKLEELARDEKSPKENNALLLNKIINSEVKESDIQNLQQTLINSVEKPKDELNLDGNETHDLEGK